MEKTGETPRFGLKGTANVFTDAWVTRKEEQMTHADMKIDEFSVGLIFPVQPHLRTSTYLHESDQLLG